MCFQKCDFFTGKPTTKFGGSAFFQGTATMFLGREKAKKKVKGCLLNPCNVVAQLVTPQRDAVDTTMTFT